MLGQDDDQHGDGAEEASAEVIAACVIGAVKKNGSMRYSKSCWTARPMTAATTVSADHAEERDGLRDRVRRVDPHLAAAERDDGVRNAPPAAAIHSIASAKKIAK